MTWFPQWIVDMKKQMRILETKYLLFYFYGYMMLESILVRYRGDYMALDMSPVHAYCSANPMKKNRAVDKTFGRQKHADDNGFGGRRQWWPPRLSVGWTDRSWQLPLGQNCQNPNIYKDVVWLKSSPKVPGQNMRNFFRLSPVIIRQPSLWWNFKTHTPSNDVTHINVHLTMHKPQPNMIIGSACSSLDNHHI